MVDKLEKVKQSTIAIDLAEENKFPRYVLGTGFFVSSDASIMSAAHVFVGCAEAQQYRYEKYGEKLGIVAGIAFVEGGKFRTFSVRIGKQTMSKIRSYDLGYMGQDFDVAVAKLEEEGSKPLAFLDLHTTKPNLYEEVAMCLREM